MNHQGVATRSGVRPYPPSSGCKIASYLRETDDAIQSSIINLPLGRIVSTQRSVQWGDMMNCQEGSVGRGAEMRLTKQRIVFSR